MSMTEPTRFRTEDRPPEGVFLGADSGPGWLMFCASMIGLLAVMNFIYGIAAVSDSTFFVGEAEFVLGGLNTWGWVLILVARRPGRRRRSAIAAQLAGARWVGVGIVAVNAVVQLLILPAYPWWAAMLFALDVLVIYGLIAHGARRELTCTSTPRPTTSTPASRWLIFAGVMLAIVGVLNLIYGIAMIGNSTFFVDDTKFVLANLNFWGWVLADPRRRPARHGGRHLQSAGVGALGSASPSPA